MLKLIFIFSLLGTAWSHPVIYQRGWALNSSNMGQFSNNYVMYSPTNRIAVGVDHWRFTEENSHHEAGLFKMNHLLWRDNSPNYQANIYLHGGLGGLNLKRDKPGTHGFYMGGVEADWETRTLYVSAKHYQFHAPSKLDIFMTQARVGFAPFEADYKQLQSWFMVQAMVIDELQEKVMITPMLRFFYRNVLWEMGSSTRGDWMLNLMVHI
jgi:hypothetical protein